MEKPEGKVAVVTGTVRGTGLVPSEAFAAAGCRALIAHREGDALERAAGGRHLAIRHSCFWAITHDTKREALERWSEEILAATP